MQRNCKNKAGPKIQAAEQRAVVAHSASYGLNRPPTDEAPGGAKENHFSTTHFFRPQPGQELFLPIRSQGFTVGYSVAHTNQSN